MKMILFGFKVQWREIRTKAFVTIACLISTQISSGQTEIFSTPGTYTWIVPPCVTTVTVQEWGGGGGGGGSYSRARSDFSSNHSEACSEGGGGGGGGYVSRTYTVVPGDMYTIVVGAGGTGGIGTATTSAGNNGIAGGLSSFAGPATVLVGATLIANGGGFGGGAYSYNNGGGNHIGSDGTAGTGGSGSGYTTMFTGGNGSSGRHSGSCYDASGAGGGGAGTGANGSNGTAPASCTLRTGGAGGTFGGGAGANGARLTVYNQSYQGFTPAVATIRGGGGGGAMIHCNSNGNEGTVRTRPGGAGARGEVWLTYTLPNPPAFTAALPICSGAPLSPLPTTSTNGITGTWSPALDNTTTTTYTFTPTAGQCANAATMTITVNPNPTVMLTTTQACNSSTNGSSMATPGSGTSPYTYAWSNGQTSQTATGLIAGNYTLTITDSGGCTSTAGTAIVSSPPLIGQFTKGTANCTGCGCKEWIIVNASGGTSPYSYSWPDGYVNRYKNQLCPGNYTVNIKDKNGCSINVSLTTP